jgi:hypothetical protein
MLLNRSFVLLNRSFMLLNRSFVLLSRSFMLLSRSFVSIKDAPAGRLYTRRDYNFRHCPAHYLPPAQDQVQSSKIGSNVTLHCLLFTVH